MVSFFSHKVVYWLTKNKETNDEDLEVYLYVFDYLIENILFLGVVIVVAVFTEMIKEMLVFLVLFSLLRKTAGGAHADTPEKFEQITH